MISLGDWIRLAALVALAVLEGCRCVQGRLHTGACKVLGRHQGLNPWAPHAGGRAPRSSFQTKL